MRHVLVGVLMVAALAMAGCADEGRRRPYVGKPIVAEAAVGHGGNIYGGAFSGAVPASRAGEFGDLFGGASGRVFTQDRPGMGSSPTVLEAPAEPAAGVAAVVPRKVIYSGAFDIAVPDVEKAIAETKQMAEKMGGYMQKMTGDGIVVRVPAEKFDTAVEALEKMGAVVEREITAQDVTEDYVDVAIRLENAKRLLEKLRQLLDKAQNVKDALAVETELARVRNQIESLQGRLNVLRNRITYATISATFVPTEEAPEEVRTELPFAWLSETGLDSLFEYVRSSYDMF